MSSNLESRTVKQRALLKKLEAAAQEKGLELVFVRHGRKHDLYRVGDFRLTIGRHPDIPERTALKTIKEVEDL